MAFLIHERKHAKWHQLLFKYLKDKIPRLDKKKIPFVVDQEPGLKKAIQEISGYRLTVGHAKQNLTCRNEDILCVFQWSKH